MTGTVTLRLETEGNAASDIGAIATLQRIASRRGNPVRRREKRLSVIVPSNTNGYWTTVSVAPGRWLVEATLPSGEIITEEVNVPNNKSVPVILRSSERSPNEWLGWQHLLGNVEGAAPLRGGLEQDHVDDIHVTPGVRPWFARVKALVARAGTTRVDAPHVRLTFNFPSGDGSAWTKLLTSGPSMGDTCPPAKILEDSATWLYRFGDTPERTLGIFGGTRAFADVVWGPHRKVISLPLPWPGRGPHGVVPTELMLRRRPPDHTMQIGLAVLDEKFGSLSGLMTASTLPQAAIAVRQAYDMLFDKIKNPLAAAAGGYILLSTSDSSEHDWHGWIENLERLFPTIPDGAILNGSLRLRCPRGDKNAPMEAKASFLEAFARGIPYFSAGISWLLDGLTLFADDKDVAEKADQVQRVAHRLDVSQAFTVIRLNQGPPR